MGLLPFRRTRFSSPHCGGLNVTRQSLNRPLIRAATQPRRLSCSFPRWLSAPYDKPWRTPIHAINVEIDIFHEDRSRSRRTRRRQGFAARIAHIERHRMDSWSNRNTPGVLHAIVVLIAGTAAAVTERVESNPVGHEVIDIVVEDLMRRIHPGGASADTPPKSGAHALPSIRHKS
jgi:hypothetical protein